MRCSSPFDPADSRAARGPGGLPVTIPPRFRFPALATTVRLARALALSVLPAGAANFAVRLDETVQPHVAANDFSGAVLVACRGAVLFERAYGFANREWEIPNPPETHFRIGSITKQFTAVAVLLLEERGHLKLDDPVSVPGEGHADTNSNYLVLALIAETRGGRRCGDFLRDQLLEPLGLRVTSYQRRQVVDHGGSIAGFSAYLAHYPDEGLTVVVLSNLATRITAELSRRLAAAALGDGDVTAAPVTPFDVPATILARCVGSYEVRPGIRNNIRLVDGHRTTQLTGQRPHRLVAVSETHSILVAVKAAVEFERGPDGRVTHLVMRQHGRSRRTPRVAD